MDDSRSVGVSQVVTDSRKNETSGVAEEPGLENDLSYGPGERLAQPTFDEARKINKAHLTNLASVQEEESLVKIWIGTREIPPIEVWSPKQIDGKALKALLFLSLNVTIERDQCWPWSHSVELEGGEEFILIKEGDLVTNYLEYPETQDEIDRIYDEAAVAEDDKENERYTLNHSESYWPQRTLSIKPTTNVEEIWGEAERRLKTNRTNFSLAVNRHYITSGEGAASALVGNQI
jgi:hypothetical protein